MGKTSIEWTNVTWNPVRGCSRVSEGCRNCYAERQAARFCSPQKETTVPDSPFYGFVTKVNGHPAWTGKVELVEKHLEDPLRWREPRCVFVNSMSDLFHEALPDEVIDRVFAVMALGTHHTYQVLTKRPERALAYMLQKRNMRETVRGILSKIRLPQIQLEIADERLRCEYLPNVWLGVSVEDQKTADERIPILLQTPAAVRFVSYEPALGPVDFTRIDYRKQLRDTLVSAVRWSAARHGEDADAQAAHAARSVPDGELGEMTPTLDVLSGHWFDGWDQGDDGRKLDWVIVGGESGPRARPFDIAWARNAIAQCKAAGVACFVKQLGAFPVNGAAKTKTQPPETYREPLKLNDRKGGDMSEWPEELRVREFPNA